MELSVKVKVLSGETGISVYMDENHHYDLALTHKDQTCHITLNLKVGDIKHQQAVIPISHNEAKIKIRSNAINYEFIYYDEEKEIQIGSARTRYLSSEVAGGFTGVIMGLYTQGGSREVLTRLPASHAATTNVRRRWYLYPAKYITIFLICQIFILFVERNILERCLRPYNIGNLYLRHNGKAINRLFMSCKSIVIMDKVKAILSILNL